MSEYVCVCVCVCVCVNVDMMNLAVADGGNALEAHAEAYGIEGGE